MVSAAAATLRLSPEPAPGPGGSGRAMPQAQLVRIEQKPAAVTPEINSN